MPPDETDRPQTCALFAPDLAQLTTAQAIGAYLKERHQAINTPEALVADSAGLMAYNTALVDAVLRRLFDCAVHSAVALAPTIDEVPALSVVATGGYGRRELAPHSDVDLTFVAAHEDDSYLNAIIKDMFQTVMDVFLYGAGLKVGYAYRLLGELGQLDHQTQTSLLDMRFLCGNLALFKEFRGQFRSRILTADFLFQKWAERCAVLEKQGGDQVYVVEPRIKEGAGGLRDIQTAEWIGEVRFHVGLSRLWQTLVEQGIVGEDDACALSDARRFLLCVRSALHLVAGEARETLTTEKQEAIASLMHYPDVPDVPPVETFMRDYYRHAANARRVARKAVRRCLDSRLELGLGLASLQRTLVVDDADVAERDPALPLHVAELAQAYSLSTDGQIAEDIPAYLKRHPTPSDPTYTGRIFTRILSTGRSVSDTLVWMEEVGTLGWLLPEFGTLMTLIPYDAAHEYTVGAHSLHVVQILEALRTESDVRLTTLKRLIGELAFPEVLFLAGLVHDVGKQWPGAHAQTGSEAAVSIGRRIGWDSERIAKLSWLVRNHLMMAETSRFRDLSLDETLRDFLKHVPDLDALNMLYLLTYADTQAVGAGIWTEVNAKFLAELYHRAETALAVTTSTEQADTPIVVPDLARQRERIRKGLAKQDLPADLIHEHTRNLPAQYLLNTPLEEMYLHIAMINRLRETFQPIFDFKSDYGSDYTELTLCAFDEPQPGLLARITGVLYAHDINVHVAQVFTREASVRIALDTLWIDFRGKPLASGKKADVQESLRRVLMGDIGIGALLQKYKKPIKEQTIYSASIDDAASERYSLLEVSSPDERGVLYRLTRTISSLGWNIHSARLSVWGSRARDAFYISDLDGNKIPAVKVDRLLAALPHVTVQKKQLRK